MTTYNLWYSNEENKKPKQNNKENKQKTNIKEIQYKEVSKKEETKEKEYYILADKTRTGRQQYLFGYKDCNDYSISVVPQHFNYNKCKKLIEKATKELNEKRDIFNRPYPVPNFQIITEEEWIREYK